MKKTLSIFLALVMALGVFALNSFAAAETETDVPSDTVLKEIDLTFDFDIGGKNVADYKDYITINSSGVKFEDEYDGFGVVAGPVDAGEAEKYIEGEIYGVSIYLTPTDGYVIPLGGKVKAVVNGKEFDSEIFVAEHYIEETEELVEIPTCHIFLTVVIGPQGGFAYGKTGKLINEISIDVNLEAGLKVADWTEYVTINTPNLVFDDQNGFAGAFVYDGAYNQLPNDYVFVAGEEYYVEVQLAPEAGYSFPFDGIEKVTVNGEKTEDYYIGTYYNDDYAVIDFASVTANETAEGSNSVLDSISNYFVLLFAGIENYFATMLENILLLFLILG